MKNKFIKISFYFLTLLLMFSCAENDDYTGDTVLTVSSPSLEVSLGFSESQTLIEAETSYDFTVSISETQAVDVVVYLEQTEGTATAGEDFSMPSSLTIKKGSLSASDVITIHEDEIMEDTETVTIKIGAGNEANVSGVSSKTVSFNIENVTDGDLVIGMSWEISTATTDDTGAAIGAYDYADLRLSLTNVPYTQILQTADGASNETYTLSGDAPDGEYYLMADIYDSMEDVIRDLNITLTFNQKGVINDQTHTFSNGLNTEFVCANNYLIMAKVIKSGENYTLEEIAENSAAPSIEGTYDVVSNGESTDPGPTNNPLVDFPSTVEVTGNGDGTYTFSDGWAGVYVEWYEMYGVDFLEPQSITLTPCLDLSGGWIGPFGAPQLLSGTVNSNGTLSIRIDNGWGDFVDQEYTIQ